MILVGEVYYGYGVVRWAQSVDAPARQVGSDFARTPPSRGLVTGLTQCVSLSPEAISCSPCSRCPSRWLAPVSEATGECDSRGRDGGSEEEGQWSRGRREHWRRWPLWVPPMVQKFRRCENLSRRPRGQLRSAQSKCKCASQKLSSGGQKRLAVHDAERHRLAEELEESEARLGRLREVAAQAPAAQLPDLGTQVQNLRQLMNWLQEERDAMAQELHGIAVPRARQRTCPSHVLRGSDANSDSTRVERMD